MDEPVIVADRKLILNKGSIRCLGNSVFLRSLFQMKYSLEIEIKYFEMRDQYISNALHLNHTMCLVSQAILIIILTTLMYIIMILWFILFQQL
ncbi:hypothetical protein BCR36DRAFT_148970 [Piromyces finnis]|uniref:Uncharacterized protein n=1 Tax=Piromyces finnis TaxID=1754191 RepID=A0A1Y1UXN5_9FUNG|nr:hypothetical protein BCR36DRAFT_148970 [Piromyces finnis]|eukprot:ORX42907.1 hypothetical protein BCR36DRAFT_148970 [Piromyces finnis]